ncbi:myb-like protein U [Drosophila eugracilis]|uniref:myb-like protein U n=1 Tax=Drosophila eugracilis TaxID=29029 RepID=UPI001BDA0247|nr:myb-like protein U [Drosophila eugracilis]
MYFCQKRHNAALLAVVFLVLTLVAEDVDAKFTLGKSRCRSSSSRSCSSTRRSPRPGSQSKTSTHHLKKKTDKGQSKAIEVSRSQTNKKNPSAPTLPIGWNVPATQMHGKTNHQNQTPTSGTTSGSLPIFHAHNGPSNYPHQQSHVTATVNPMPEGIFLPGANTPVANRSSKSFINKLVVGVGKAIVKHNNNDDRKPNVIIINNGSPQKVPSSPVRTKATQTTVSSPRPVLSTSTSTSSPRRKAQSNKSRTGTIICVMDKTFCYSTSTGSKLSLGHFGFLSMVLVMTLVAALR